MATFSFDSSTVEKREENSYELLPVGWYTAQIIESNVAALKSGNGQALKLSLEVLTDGYRGRRLWVNLNVRHTNPEAERIAQQQLREICDAIGVARFTDTTELHNKPLQVRVKIRKDVTGQYGDQNDCAGFKAADGVMSPTASFASRPAPAAAVQTPASGATPPWAKKAA